MFIVVAIVIFGIFVSLSYTLFGKTLQPQVVSLFETSTSQSIQELRNEKLGENLIKLDTVDAPIYYHTQPEFVDNKMRVVMKDKPSFLTIRGLGIDKVEGKKYKTSGYITINDKPISEDFWVTKRVSTYNRNKAYFTKFDSKTGYFEMTSVWKLNEVDKGTNYILHKDLSEVGNIKKGDVFIINDLKLQEVL